MAVVARRDYLRTVRRRGFLVGTVLLPVSLSGLVALAAFLAPDAAPPGAPPPITVVNESRLQLGAPEGADLRQLSRPEARASVERGEVAEFYLIPAEYPEQPVVQRIIGPASGSALEDVQRRTQQERLLAATLRMALLREAGAPAETITRVVVPYEMREAGVDGGPPPSPLEVAGVIVPYVLTFLFVLSIFITSGYLLQSVTEEKENRVVEILLSSVPPNPLMAGKILGLGAAGLTQVAAWVATGLLVLPVLLDRTALGAFALPPLTLALAILFFVLGYLAFGAIFAAIGALAPGTREAQQYSGFFGFFAVIPLILAGIFLTDPASPIVVALAVFPLTAPAAMLQLLAMSAEPPWLLLALSLASLSAFALVATLVAARIFRATLLLYGVRPSLGRIVDAVTARG